MNDMDELTYDERVAYEAGRRAGVEQAAKRVKIIFEGADKAELGAQIAEAILVLKEAK